MNSSAGDTKLKIGVKRVASCHEFLAVGMCCTIVIGIVPTNHVIRRCSRSWCALACLHWLEHAAPACEVIITNKSGMSSETIKRQVCRSPTNGVEREIATSDP
jgi:hypothetical protein